MLQTGVPPCPTKLFAPREAADGNPVKRVEMLFPGAGGKFEMILLSMVRPGDI